MRDRRTTEELINTALNDEENENAAWEAVSVLQFRGNYEVFTAAQKLCASQNSKERMLGVTILGQLGIPERSFLDESLTILLPLLEKEKNTDVLHSLGIALGHIGDSRAIAPLVKLKNHPDVKVRYAVVYGLLGQTDILAIRTLIELSSDEDELVRDWATFGLRTLELDTKEIREALFQRLADTDEIVRREALVGLALRKDERVVEPLIKELLSIKELSYDRSTDLVLEAAREIDNPKIYPILIQLKQSCWENNNYLSNF